jgi:hypothetical protein
VAAVTALVFLRSVGLGFVAWDAEIFLGSNPAFRGLGLLQAYARIEDSVGAQEVLEVLATPHPALALASQVGVMGSGPSLRP